MIENNEIPIKKDYLSHREYEIKINLEMLSQVNLKGIEKHIQIKKITRKYLRKKVKIIDKMIINELNIKKDTSSMWY